MNKLKQLPNGIISSKKDYDFISKKDSAQILVMSDSHGSASILRNIILTYGQKVDALFFAGDGFSDVLSCLEESFKEEYFMQYIPPVLAIVKGNNDSQSYTVNFNPYLKDNKKTQEDDFKTYKIFAHHNILAKIANKNILLTHGNEFGVYYSTEPLTNFAKQNNADIAIFGHTHCPTEMLQQIYLLNPGSISLPRNMSKPCFAILNITKKVVYSIFYKIDKSNPVNFTPYHPEILYY